MWSWNNNDHLPNSQSWSCPCREASALSQPDYNTVVNKLLWAEWGLWLNTHQTHLPKYTHNLLISHQGGLPIGDRCQINNNLSAFTWVCLVSSNHWPCRAWCSILLKSYKNAVNCVSKYYTVISILSACSVMLSLSVLAISNRFWQEMIICASQHGMIIPLANDQRVFRLYTVH